MEQHQDNCQHPQTHYVYVEKKDGCFTKGLKIGCGFIIFIWILSFLIGFFAAFTSDEEKPVFIQYYQVTNGKKEVTIHSGMSKDSVIILLGQPTEFDSSDYWDKITYNYGKMGLSRLTIKFKDGKVSSVQKDDNDYIYDNVDSLMKE